MRHACLALALVLVPTPALARPGATLAESVAIVRAAKVPFAVLVERRGRIAMEEWHSYTTPTQETGPWWEPAAAHAMRRAMMGPGGVESARKTSWASFPVWTFTYPPERRALYGSKRGAARIWSIMGTSNDFWVDAPAIWFAVPGDANVIKVLHGKVMKPERSPKQEPAPTPTATPRRPKPRRSVSWDRSFPFPSTR